MSDRPERPPTKRFADALNVPRNATVGLVAGVAFAAGLYAVFVVLPAETARSPAWYLVLAFVVAVSTALVVAALLTVVSAVRLSRDG